MVWNIYIYIGMRESPSLISVGALGFCGSPRRGLRVAMYWAKTSKGIERDKRATNYGWQFSRWFYYLVSGGL